MKTLAQVIGDRAEESPDAAAFFEGDSALSFLEYARRSDRLASLLIELGLESGERVAVQLRDGPGLHTAFVGIEKAGLVIVGIGPRAGVREISHLIATTGAVALLSHAQHRGVDMAGLFLELRAEGVPLRHHLVAIDLDDGDPLLLGTSSASPAEIERRRLGPDDLWLINSTSGTTGLPKCVTHHQARWQHFHELAVESGELCPEDVFLSAIPAPFGFGIWTAHFTPTLLGAPTVLMANFDAALMIAEIERHRVSVLAAVSTQFVMMLNSRALLAHDVSSLRVLFTGGEAVPTERAAEFEEKTGACVLQFYGSNETGALSRTSTRDSRETRLGTAGRVIPSQKVRLYDATGNDVTVSGKGQPACRGPLTSHGYYDDPAANAQLYSADGWMLTGDIATLDAEGVLRVVGRVADFIVRGGKNISGPEVEAAVMTHPDVALAAAVAIPDEVFGERVCVFVELRMGSSLNLEELTRHLAARGISKETFPERLEILDALPRSSGGKVAKAQLRDLAKLLR